MGNLTALQQWLQHNALAVVLLFVGVVVMARSHNGDHKGALTTFGIVLIGLTLVGLAVGNGATTVSAWLVHLVTS